MLARINEQRKPVWVSLVSSKINLTSLSVDYRILNETLMVLSHFKEATVKLSGKKSVSGSKVIPMLKMLYLALQHNASNIRTVCYTSTGKTLKKERFLLKFTNDLTAADSNSFNILILDMNAAFDTVHHFSLLNRWTSIAITNTILNWFHSNLTGHM